MSPVLKLFIFPMMLIDDDSYTCKVKIGDNEQAADVDVNIFGELLHCIFLKIQHCI